MIRLRGNDDFRAEQRLHSRKGKKIDPRRQKRHGYGYKIGAGHLAIGGDLAVGGV